MTELVLACIDKVSLTPLWVWMIICMLLVSTGFFAGCIWGAFSKQANELDIRNEALKEGYHAGYADRARGRKFNQFLQ